MIAYTSIAYSTRSRSPNVPRKKRRSWNRRFLLVALLPFAGCSLPVDDVKLSRASLGRVDFTPNPNMVTAAVAHIECKGSVAVVEVIYTATGIDSGRTPRTPVTSCPLTLDLLGLLAGTAYTTVVRLWGAAEDSTATTGPNLVTKQLPTDLPHVTVRAPGGTSSGLTVFNILDSLRLLTHGAAMMVDSAGRVRWYLLSNRLIGDFQPQRGRRYTVAVTDYEPLAFATLGYTTAEYQELDRGGTFIRKWTTTGGYPTDGHEIRLTDRGTAVLLGFDFRIMDLTSFQGAPDAQIIGNVLQEVDSTGRVLFQWNTFDNFSITDIDPSVSLTTQRIDWNHGNAIEIDADGNYLASFRHLSEVTKIDAGTGAVLWRMGGVRNQFRFVPDSLTFSFQHGVRRLPNGDLILFDNGNTHAPPFSRVIEYHLDEQAKTATAVWTYRPDPDLFSFALGFAQRLANGNTVVTFGPRGVVQEASNSGTLVWELTLPQGLWIYRAYRVRSAYDPSPL